MEALDIESNSVHKAFKNEILTEGIILHLYLLNLITNQYRTILCYQRIAYIHLKINYTKTQILNESTMKSFRKWIYWKSIWWEDTRKNSLFAPQSKKTKQNKTKVRIVFDGSAQRKAMIFRGFLHLKTHLRMTKK